MFTANELDSKIQLKLNLISLIPKEIEAHIVKNNLVMTI